MICSQPPTIVVYGNIASGKSTLSRALLHALPGWTYACMDQLRLEANATDPEMDRFALDRLCEDKLMALLKKDVPIIYESSGATQIFRRAMQYIDGRRGASVRIRTMCAHNTAMYRFRVRKAGGHRQLMPAVRKPMPIDECWYRFEDLIRVPPTLLIDTDRTDPSDALRLALQHIRQRIFLMP